MALALSSTSPSAVSKALSEFQASLSNERKAHLLANCSAPCALDVLMFTADLDRANAARRRRGVASRFCTILESIQQYTAVMDTYSQVKADTTSLIWGSMKLCIHVASNAASYYDKLSEWFMRLGRLCPRYSEWQSLFPHDLRLQKALDEFYATVIRFCAKAIEVLDRSGILNFVSTLWKPFELEFAALEKDLKEQRAEIDNEIRLAAAQIAHRERAAASDFRDSFLRNFTVWRSADERRNKTINRAKSLSAKQCRLDQLSSFDYKAALKENRKKRHGSSCSWLAEQPNYRQWLAEPQSSVFWLSGGVGCGKSVLCAATVDDILRNHVKTSTAVSFLFCSENNAESLSAAAILRSLIRQCLTPENLAAVLEVPLQEALKHGAPEPGELESLFSAVSLTFQTHFVLIDGLDECSTEGQRAILRTLGSVLPEHPWRLKLFVSSRDDMSTQSLSSFTTQYPLTVSRKHVDADIAAYVVETLRSKIAEYELRVGSPELVESIKHALVNGASGMFLWVVFQIQEICEQTCDKDIRRVITSLPKGLEETYQRIARRVIERGKAGIAKKVFCWAGAARRPLTLEEMHEAIAVEVGQVSFQHDQLVNGFDLVGLWCGNLVTVDEESCAVQFAHPSVKQFLSATREPFHFCPREADLQVGRACVTYLCFSDFERQLMRTTRPDLSLDPMAVASTSLSAACGPVIAKGVEMLGRMWTSPSTAKLDALHHIHEARASRRAQAIQRQFSFLAYASEYWLAHTSNFTESTLGWSHFRRLVVDDGHFAGLWSKLQCSGAEEKLVRCIVEHGHVALLASLRRWRPQLLAGHIDALFRASCAKGLRDLTMAVLDGAEAEEVPLDDWLNVAAAAGDADVAVRLVSMGADIDDGDGKLLTPVHVAALRGHSQVVKRLLSAGADVKAYATGIGGQSLLRVAAHNADLDLVKMLIDAGATFEDALTKFDGHVAIEAAAKEDRYPLARKLVFAGASVAGNETWSKGWTFLQVAASLKDKELVVRLIDAGADVNAEAARGGGRTALQAAVQSVSLWTVKDLFDGADGVIGDNADKSEHSVLLAAARYTKLDMIQCLLDAGADVNAEPAELGGQTALQLAAGVGDVAIVQCLLDAGADVNAKAARYNGGRALQVAARAGHYEVVDRLLFAGAHVNAAPAQFGGGTALEAAKRSRNAAMVDKLVKAGAVG